MTILAEKRMPVNPKRPKDKSPVMTGVRVRIRENLQVERTVPLTLRQAERFAETLKRFDYQNVSIASDIFQTDRFRVRYNSPAHRNLMIELRIQRGIDQSPDMVFMPIGLQDSYYHCIHLFIEQETYTMYDVSLDNAECTCPDYINRRKWTNDTCKHIVALAGHLGVDLKAILTAKEEAERTKAEAEKLKRLREMGLADCVGETPEAKANRADYLVKLNEGLI